MFHRARALVVRGCRPAGPPRGETVADGAHLLQRVRGERRVDEVNHTLQVRRQLALRRRRRVRALSGRVGRLRGGRRRRLGRLACAHPLRVRLVDLDNLRPVLGDIRPRQRGLELAHNVVQTFGVKDVQLRSHAHGLVCGLDVRHRALELRLQRDRLGKSGRRQQTTSVVSVRSGQRRRQHRRSKRGNRRNNGGSDRHRRRRRRRLLRHNTQVVRRDVEHLPGAAVEQDKHLAVLVSGHLAAETVELRGGRQVLRLDLGAHREQDGEAVVLSTEDLLGGGRGGDGLLRGVSLELVGQGVVRVVRVGSRAQALGLAALLQLVQRLGRQRLVDEVDHILDEGLRLRPLLTNVLKRHIQTCVEGCVVCGVSMKYRYCS
eukprot:Rhum_TRINITY_DN11109_c1_g1::Rhum_TRINITY_DN11109_c1_g1_i1::g.42631::m.42631